MRVYGRDGPNRIVTPICSLKFSSNAGAIRCNNARERSNYFAFGSRLYSTRSVVSFRRRLRDGLATPKSSLPWSNSITSGSVETLYETILTALQNPDLVQAARWSAVAAAAFAEEMFKVKRDLSRTIRISRERVQGFWILASTVDGGANFGR